MNITKNDKKWTYKTVDVENISMGEISKSEHFENVKY